MMKINGVDIIQLRNMPVPKKGKQSLALPVAGLSTLIQLEAKTSKGIFTGLGEVRAIPSISQEAPKEAFIFARKLANQLISSAFDESCKGTEIAKHTADRVDSAVREAMGILPNDPLPQNGHPSVRFAFDCALIDIFSQLHEAEPVSLLTGRTPTVVHRNVFAKSFKNPNAVINNILSNNLPSGWLRSGYRKDGSSLAALLNSLTTVSRGRSSMEGILLDIAETWTFNDLNILADLLEVSPIMQDCSFGLILEQPFPVHATKYYQQSIERLGLLKEKAGIDVRIMLDESISDRHSIDAFKPLLPYVDLNLSPQKAGSIHEMLLLVEQARAFGFDGHIYLSNAGTNTELNTIILVALAQIIPGVDLFSAMPRQEERIHLVYPEVQLSSASENELMLPLGTGWATRLSQSGLKHRLKQVLFVRGQEISQQGREALKQLLIMKAIDDSNQSSDDEGQATQQSPSSSEWQEMERSVEVSSETITELSSKAT